MGSKAGAVVRLSEEERRISDTRQSTYGAWQPNMAATSENMSGLYRQFVANNPGKPLPDWWAPLMQVAVKLNRIASGTYHEDNFVDIRVYLSFIEQMQEASCTAAPATTPCPGGDGTTMTATTTATDMETHREQ